MIFFILYINNKLNAIFLLKLFSCVSELYVSEVNITSGLFSNRKNK
jgi:hypothetical protein